jgi:predicted oxidoreductase
VILVGTSKIESIKHVVEALNIDMSSEQWYKKYTVSTGIKLP